MCVGGSSRAMSSCWHFVSHSIAYACCTRIMSRSSVTEARCLRFVAMVWAALVNELEATMSVPIPENADDIVTTRPCNVSSNSISGMASPAHNLASPCWAQRKAPSRSTTSERPTDSNRAISMSGFSPHGGRLLPARGRLKDMAAERPEAEESEAQCAVRW
eukprot:2077604-Pyramimonas_sp.AAC.1